MATIFNSEVKHLLINNLSLRRKAENALQTDGTWPVGKTIYDITARGEVPVLYIERHGHDNIVIVESIFKPYWYR